MSIYNYYATPYNPIHQGDALRMTARKERVMGEEATKTTFMDKFQAVMEKTVVPIGMKISQQKYLAAIRDGMTVIIGVTIVGGFACLLAVPPHS